MEKEVRSYYKYKGDIVYLLAVSGLWPEYKRYSKSVKNCLTGVAVVTEFCTIFGIASFCVQNLNSIKVLTKGISFMISYSSAFLKVLIFTFNSKDLMKLNCSLSNQFEKDLKLSKNRQHLLAYCNSFQKYFKLHYYYTGAIILLMAITPLLALRHGKYVRAYPQLVPFDYKKGGLVHWGMYGFELAGAYFGWTNTVGPDSAFGLYTLHMVGELRLLSSRFRNLKSGDNYQRQLKECVDKHVLLIQSKHVMQRLFGFQAVWLAVTSAIVICAIIFQLSQIQNMTVKVIYLIIYCVVKFIQAYTYAWFGHIINVESETCLDSIYEAEWGGDLRFMNDALIILSQSPMFFEAFNFMIVRLDMFSKIHSGRLYGVISLTIHYTIRHMRTYTFIWYDHNGLLILHIKRGKIACEKGQSSPKPEIRCRYDLFFNCQRIDRKTMKV